MKIKPIGHLVKTNPIQTQFVERAKSMQSVYLQGIKKKNADMSFEKTNPIQTQSRNSSRAPMSDRVFNPGKPRDNFLDLCVLI